VINGEDPDLAACYFDVDSGTFSACANIGAMSTLLTIETDGPPILDQILFGSQEIQEITVPEGMTLVVQNISTDEENSEHHFYLNYLTAHFVPLDPALPLSTPILMPSCSEVGSEVGGPLTGAGPGCSDSNYP
jgi:hypothetical protein